MPPPAGTAKPYDGTPFLPAAGLGATRDEALNTAERILKPEIYAPEAPVPEELKKWRKQMEPGQVCLHPGVADDADHERLEIYGKARSGYHPIAQSTVDQILGFRAGGA